MSEKSRILLEINIAIFLIAFSGLFSKLVELPAEQIIFGRCAFCILGLILLKSILKRSFKLQHKKDLPWLILTGVLLITHWVTMYYAIQVSTVAVGIISLFTFPILTVFIEPFFYKSKPKWIDVLLSIIIFMGVGFIPEKIEFGDSMTMGVGLGLISAINYSLRNILTKKHLSHVESSNVMFYQVSSGIILLAPFCLLFNDFSPTGKDLGYLALLGILFTAIAHTIFVGTLSRISAKTASVLASLQPIYTILLAILFLNEYPSLKALIGGLIILSAVFVEVIRFKKS